MIEILLRGGAVGAFAGLAIVCLRGALTPARMTGVLFCLAAAAHTLTQYPQLQPALGTLYYPVWAFSAAGAGFFWAFAIELFGDRSRLEPVRFAPAIALLVVAMVGALTSEPVAKLFWMVHNIMGAALMAHVLYVVWSGWRNDLVESRRRLRGPLLGLGAFYVLVVAAVQFGEIVWRPADALSPVAAGALFLFGLASIGALLRADADLFVPRPAAPRPEPAPPATLSGADARLADRLTALMAEDRAYREENLTVAALAAKVGVPEHRLRRLINEQLGFRNFSAFLNEWRLGDAKQALADPAQRDVPIFDDRARCWLSVARTVQSRVQGGYRADADRVQDTSDRGRGARPGDRRARNRLNSPVNFRIGEAPGHFG